MSTCLLLFMITNYVNMSTAIRDKCSFEFFFSFFFSGTETMFDDQRYQWLQWQLDGEEAEQNVYHIDILERRYMRRRCRVVPDRMNPFIAMSDLELV